MTTGRSDEASPASTDAAKLVYFFGNGAAEGTKEMKAALGGKGANLAEMTNLGVPVPPGFTIACVACVTYLGDHTISPALRAEVERNLRRLEESTQKGFGDREHPLLVSVRSGAAVSMPGMMETILNLGLNDETVEGLARQSGNGRFAYDSYRRFIQMYADVVLGVPLARFEHLLGAKRLMANVETDAELPEDVLRTLVEEYKALVRNATGAPFPTDPLTQLWGAIEAVWRSWTLKKAVDFRRVHAIPETLGTGVNIVAMVFGNMGDDSGTGVAFTRDPSTGERRFYGEFLVNAQGEDVRRGHSNAARHRTDGGPLAERVHGVVGDAAAARVALPGHAGHRVHGRARHALPPADAQRQARSRSRRAHRARHGRRGTHHARRSR